MSNYRRRLMNSTFAKPIKKTQALIEFCSTINSSNRIKTGHNTIYCISPYKTGTTFLAAAYPNEVSQHEPMQYLSLKKFENNFSDFFLKRLNALNLKLECSGFFSAYIDELANHKVAKNLDYIIVVRKPSKWINSVVNYWSKLDYLNNDYINERFWKKKVGVDLLNFKFKSESEQEDIVNKLAAFYFDFTEKSRQLKNITYVKIHEIEDYVKVLDSKIDEKAKIRHDKKRVNNLKYYDYKNEKLDLQYDSLIESLNSENNKNQIN
ncbi:hypothetical protein [uncultured Winogradskyella sp.]|uniref:hypothetical protein n=1 Tax=uncultured Winogradskyella sp. TaxID=395353 RepID=UPI0026235A50|nr:hypothetical protein [uncultured Winogradskyella sp.]